MNSKKVAVGLGLSMQMILGNSGVGAVPLALATVAAIARPAEATVLSNWAFDSGTRQLQVVLPNGITPRYFLLAEPTRIVLDIPNTDVGNIPTEQTYAGTIRSIRIAQFDNRSTRIVMELAPNTVLDPQQAQLDQIVGEDQTRWVLQPLLSGMAPSTVPDGIPVAAQMADPALEDTGPAMQFSEDDPGTPLADANQNSLLTLAEELNRPNSEADPNTLPGAPSGNSTNGEPTVSVPPLANAEAPPSAAPNVTVPPLDSGISSTPDNGSSATTPITPEASGPQDLTEDDSLAITPEEAADSVSIAVEPAGPEIADAAESAPSMPPFLAETNLDEEVTALDLPEPTAPEANHDAPETVASAPSATPPTPPTTATEPLPELAEPAAEAPSIPESVTPPPTVDSPPPAAAPDTVPDNGSSPNTVPEAAANTVPDATDDPASPPVAVPNTLPDANNNVGSEVGVDPIPDAPPFLSAPETPPAPETATTTTPVPPPPPSTAGTAPTIPFGQPLPTSSEADRQARSPNSTPPITPFADALLTAGTTLPLAYTHSQPLVLTGTEPLQEVLVLNQDVRNTSTGEVVLPRGTLVIGRFETNGTNRNFVTQALSIRGQNIPVTATSEALIGNPEVSGNTVLRNSGIGAAALTILTGFTGIGLIGGAALGAATTYVASPQTVVIEPNQVIQVTLVEDVESGDMSRVGEI